jgi:hypothetical protein
MVTLTNLGDQQIGSHSMDGLHYRIAAEYPPHILTQYVVWLVDARHRARGMEWMNERVAKSIPRQYNNRLR